MVVRKLLAWLSSQHQLSSTSYEVPNIFIKLLF